MLQVPGAVQRPELWLRCLGEIVLWILLRASREPAADGAVKSADAEAEISRIILQSGSCPVLIG